MADVCLIVEGAYPYITGGVSSWLHALLTNLPDLTFAIQYVGAHMDAQRKSLYTLPANVVEFREVFIGDTSQVKRRKQSRHVAVTLPDIRLLHEAIALGKPFDSNLLLPLLRRPGFLGLSPSDLFFASQSWEILVSLYEAYAAQQPFVDFFWTFRQTYLPIFTICATTLPVASVYHAVSTGFSGFLGALMKIRSGLPFLVTEHGIYTREREIEISQSSWLEQLAVHDHPHSSQRLNFFQAWWFNIYRFMERLSYDMADTIVSVTGVNQHYQLQHGAAADKLLLIPNGIDFSHLEGIRLQNHETADQFLVGFVGRIVPIKDVKTFIRALKIASETIPHLKAFLVGPTEEDEAYFQECLRLIALFNLDSLVTFTGRADVRSYYSKLDVLVLTSLSEGQPLVILEGNCAGVPVVATDVGACRELLTGVSVEDRALGSSGLITPVASPQATADAIIQLWEKPSLRQRMGRTGVERVRRFYQQEQLYSAYRELYQRFAHQKGR